jgi:hypothetical protein
MKSLTTAVEILSFLAVAAFTCAGCLLGDRCGPDQVLKGGVCVPVLTDAGSPDDEGPDGLGETCTAHVDCTGPADFCAVYPGDDTGYCTFQDCDLVENDCPDGYFCMDVSQYMPEYGTICVQE